MDGVEKGAVAAKIRRESDSEEKETTPKIADLNLLQRGCSTSIGTRKNDWKTA